MVSYNEELSVYTFIHVQFITGSVYVYVSLFTKAYMGASEDLLMSLNSWP